MNNPMKMKLSSHLVLTAILSGGITIVFSLVYILLCVAAIIFRFSSCDSKTGASYFWNTIINAYILESDCTESVPGALTRELTTDFTVFVLAAITLSFSVCCLVTAITLITIVQDENTMRYISFVVAAYIASCISSLVVDLTTAIHFGLDYTHLTTKLESSDVSLNYQTEVLRQGAFLLMSIALKGYVAPLINLVMLILLVVYAVEHRRLLKSNEHSIHKLGALAAFDQPRKPDENWTAQPEIFPTFTRGSLVNNGFVNDDEFPRTPKLESSRFDPNYANRAYDRSDSWHHTQPNLAQSSRPFSYLEDVKRPAQNKPLPAAPAVEPSWRRDAWPQGPPLPAPDYSPQPARRLKSALKTAYI